MVASGHRGGDVVGAAGKAQAQLRVAVVPPAPCSTSGLLDATRVSVAGADQRECQAAKLHDSDWARLAGAVHGIISKIAIKVLSCRCRPKTKSTYTYINIQMSTHNITYYQHTMVELKLNVIIQLGLTPRHRIGWPQGRRWAADKGEHTECIEFLPRCTVAIHIKPSEMCTLVGVAKVVQENRVMQQCPNRLPRFVSKSGRPSLRWAQTNRWCSQSPNALCNHTLQHTQIVNKGMCKQAWRFMTNQ